MAGQSLQELLLLLCCLFVVCLETKNIKVKIVEEPAVYRGVNSFYQQQHQITHTIKDLEPRVDPVPFAGPPHFSVLNGNCFSFIENSYKYELCPFHNVTQREQTVRWNAFSGILGVFQGWDIENNTFVDMLMGEGDYCPGNNPRQTKVFFKCGSEHKLISVSEPATCQYKMEFETPLACPQDALLVYPVLSANGKSKWEAIEEGLWREELTIQGYNKQRKQLFISESLIDSGDMKFKYRKERKEETVQKNKNRETKEKKEFKTLEICSKAYEELYNEVNRLRLLISPFNKQATLNTTQNNEETTPTLTQTQPTPLSNRTRLTQDNIKLHTRTNSSEHFEGTKQDF